MAAIVIVPAIEFTQYNDLALLFSTHPKGETNDFVCVFFDFFLRVGRFSYLNRKFTPKNRNWSLRLSYCCRIQERKKNTTINIFSECKTSFVSRQQVRFSFQYGNGIRNSELKHQDDFFYNHANESKQTFSTDSAMFCLLSRTDKVWPSNEWELNCSMFCALCELLFETWSKSHNCPKRIFRDGICPMT